MSTSSTTIGTEFRDDYEHIDAQIDYVLENELMPEPDPSSKNYASYAELRSLFNTSFTLACSCESAPKACAADCLHGGNYIAGSNDGLVLNSHRPVLDLIYECSSLCKCAPDCNNRLLQFGPRLHLEIVVIPRLGLHQLGLVSTVAVNRGAFVCEYAGEVLTAAEAQRRHAKSKTNSMNYIICLIERSTGSDQSVHRTYIDPTYRGNIGRYLNHSCDPNCEIISIRVDGPIPRLGIFTRKSIVAGEELTFDYAGGADEHMFCVKEVNRAKCLCGSIQCRGFLPNLKYN